MRTTTSPWFPYAAPRSSALTLFCLPPAGGGASGYRDWLKITDELVRVVPVQLPGREGRLAEPLATAAADLVGQLVEPVLSQAGERFAVFGHSMGALLALELTYALAERGHAPEHLLVSGHLPPHLHHLGPQDPPIRSMTDADLRAYLAAEGGTPAEVLAIADLMDLILPVLRADLTVCETFDQHRKPPLPMPISVFAGVDDPRTPADLLPRWAEVTSAGLRVQQFPGGHGYLGDDPAAITAAVRATLLDPPVPSPIREP